MTGDLRDRKGEDKERSCEDGGRDWSKEARPKNGLRVADSHKKLGERHGMNSPSEPPEGNNSANVFIFGFLAF